MIGARVIKTCLALTIAILTAKSLNLYAYQFAGIISVLSVQPTIYRSFRHGIQQTVSAILGALLGTAALYVSGANSFAMGVIVFLLMTLHVKMKWTNSLLVSVVIAINTMGTIGLSILQAAENQILLVIIGISVGTLVNLIHKPVHHERAELLITQSDRMLRSLLHYMIFEFEDNWITPFPVIREQIEQVRGYILRGKEIASLIMEDQPFHQQVSRNTIKIFQTFENMVERIRDMSKCLQDADLLSDEIRFSKKAIGLVIRMQENMMLGKSVNVNRLLVILDYKRTKMWEAPESVSHHASASAFYNFYGHLKDYLKEMNALITEPAKPHTRLLSYVSIDRPALLAEITFILGKKGINVTDVAIQARGDFILTQIEVTSSENTEWKEILELINRVENVLNVRLENKS